MSDNTGDAEHACLIPSNEMRAEYPTGKEMRAEYPTRKYTGHGLSPHPQYYHAYEYLPPASAVKHCSTADDSANLKRLQAYGRLCAPRSTGSSGASDIISGGHPPGKTFLDLRFLFVCDSSLKRWFIPVVLRLYCNRVNTYYVYSERGERSRRRG